MVSLLTSTAKAAEPPSVHGTLEDHGQPALLWVFSFAYYLQAIRPVPIMTAHLQDSAFARWQFFTLSTAATLEQFKQIVLDNF